MSLTHLAIRKAKPGDKPLKLVDGGGLYLLLTPTGARWWRWDYRRPVTGQRNTLNLGVYPDTSLTDARVKRDDARRQLAAGIDPGTLRQTYPVVVDDFYLGKTTREKFISVISASDARTQAAILRGIAKKYPANSEPHRTAAGHGQLLALIKKCASELAVDQTDPKISSEVVRRALADAALLIERSGPTSAVDRVHTALHAYLKAACARASLAVPDNAKNTALFKLLQQHHPTLREGAHSETMTRILNSLGNVVDALNPARNSGSLAHPNEDLLDRHDAPLAINSARAVIQYLDAKLAES